MRGPHISEELPQSAVFPAETLLLVALLAPHLRPIAGVTIRAARFHAGAWDHLWTLTADGPISSEPYAP